MTAVLLARRQRFVVEGKGHSRSFRVVPENEAETAQGQHGQHELADALDSKFRNHRFYLINSDQTPLAFFIGKSSVSRVFHSASRDGQRTAESRTKVEHNPFLRNRARGRNSQRARSNCANGRIPGRRFCLLMPTRYGSHLPDCAILHSQLQLIRLRTRASRERGVRPQDSIRHASCVVGLCIDPSPLLAHN
jgi:hypothetical protein